MPLKKRPIDRFRVVCMQDSALDGVDDSVIRAYAESGRAWELLEPHLAGLTVRPTVFICEPLRAAYDAAAVAGDVDSFRAVFAAHVVDIQGDEDARPVFHKDGEKTYLDMEYVCTLPIPWVVDVARAIIERGMGDVSPFSLPDSFWLRRRRRLFRFHAGTVAAAVSSISTASGDSGSNATESSHSVATGSR